MPPVLSLPARTYFAGARAMRSRERWPNSQATGNPLLSPKLAADAKHAALPENLFRHHDVDLLLGCATAPVLPDDHNGMLTRVERLGEITETAVGSDVGHRLPVDDQSSAGLGSAEHLGNAPVQLGSAD